MSLKPTNSSLFQFARDGNCRFAKSKGDAPYWDCGFGFVAQMASGFLELGEVQEVIMKLCFYLSALACFARMAGLSFSRTMPIGWKRPPGFHAVNMMV